MFSLAIGDSFYFPTSSSANKWNQFLIFMHWMNKNVISLLFDVYFSNN